MIATSIQGQPDSDRETTFLHRAAILTVETAMIFAIRVIVSGPTI